MKTNRHLLLSLLLNGGLLASTGYLLVLNLAAGKAKPVPPAPSLPAAPAGGELPLAAVSHPVAPPFRWGELESDNYPTYIQNLRRIGCPEQTIRDIVTADLAHLYAQHRSDPQPQAAGLLTQPKEGIMHNGMQGSPNSRNTASAQDVSALVTQLLGPGAETPPHEPPTARPMTYTGAANAALVNPLSQTGYREPVDPAKPGNSIHSDGVTASVVQRTQSPNNAAAEPDLVLDIKPDPSTGGNPGQTTAASSNNQGTVTPKSPGWTGPFTPEEQLFRMKWGWQAFDAARREAWNAANHPAQ